MVEGIIVTILTCLIIVWVGFSMAGRDEVRVSSSTDLSRWYHYKIVASIIGMEEVELDRDYISLKGRGVHKQWGYRLTLEYKNIDGSIVQTTHTFYDESEQDEKFLSKYIKDNTVLVWESGKGEVYVPGEIVENLEVQSIYGADKVLVYSVVTSVIIGLISSIFVLLLSPLWVVVHLPLVLVAGIIPQIYMYMQSINNNIQRRGYTAVSALNQYAIYVDDGEDGLNKYKLVEQTLPMVLLEEGVGYLGYTPDKVEVLVDYDGDIPVHIASEYHIPDLVKSILVKYI